MFAVMGKHRIYLFAAVFAAMVSLFSCRKKENPSPVNTATSNALKVEFSNLVGNDGMVLNDRWYQNAALDSYKISSYKYYISNIKLNRVDGTVFTEPESYHLIDQSDAASRKFEIKDVPLGDYASITYLIGVDETRNTGGAQTGALDPGKGMFWDWNTGYIMAKMEGTANTSPASGKAFFLHIAGYDLTNSVLKEITLPFPQSAKVSTGNIPNVHIFSDANQWFVSPTKISFADYSLIMKVGAQAKMVANNYADMFHVDHVDN